MISLSAGGGGSFFPRTMAGPAGSVLNYNLYSDGGRTTVWGDGTGGSASLSGSFGAGIPSTFTVYARIFRNQRGVAAGLYSDSIMVTVAP
jgi:spore coat protein U-like protein